MHTHVPPHTHTQRTRTLATWEPSRSRSNLASPFLYAPGVWEGWGGEGMFRIYCDRA